MVRNGFWLVLGVAGAILAGCASQPSEMHVAATPAVIPPRPTMPADLASAPIMPAMNADGSYATLNHGVSPDEAVWHVRSALNVAALGCRGPQEAGIIANYNALLKAQKAPLAKANAAEIVAYRARHGGDWQTEQDMHMTRLYNFFAQPAAQQRFCEAAIAVGAQAVTVSPDAFQAFAVTALATLEQPFTDVYRSYDNYRHQLAAWDARYGTQPPGTPRLDYAQISPLMDWPSSNAMAYAQR